MGMQAAVADGHASFASSGRHRTQTERGGARSLSRLFMQAMAVASLASSTCTSACGQCHYFLLTPNPNKADIADGHDLSLCEKAGCPADIGGYKLRSCSDQCFYIARTSEAEKAFPVLPNDACQPSCGAHVCVDLGAGRRGCAESQCVGGRRYAGLRRTRVRKADSPEARWLRELTHLEAASIASFRLLEAELATLGAPLALRQKARAAARDEVRHTAMVGGLAQKHGAAGLSPPRGTPRARKPRSLEAFALENAVEGCVRETLGAFVALWQSVHADDALVRATFAEIASDETGHAALAFEIAAWAEPRLSPPARRRIARRVVAATREFTDHRSVPDRGVPELGLPSSAELARAVWVLGPRLWPLDRVRDASTTGALAGATASPRRRRPHQQHA